MTDEPTPEADTADWRLATWRGAKREQIRRWSQLPLARIIAALEEMADLNAHWNPDERTRRS